MTDHYIIEEEKRLLLEIKQGSRTAFEKIYHNYAPRLTAKLIQLVKSEEIAQDLLQDIFIKIWEMRENLQIDRSFGALLYTIGTNLSYNSFRATLREQNRLLHLPLNDAYTHIEEEINYSETNQILQKAIMQLTKRQKEIYTLYKIEGKSYREISELLQISHSAINQHLQSANKIIKAYMQSHLPAIVLLLSADIIHKYI